MVVMRHPILKFFHFELHLAVNIVVTVSSKVKGGLRHESGMIVTNYILQDNT